MAIIDSGKIDDLYFVGIYRVREYGSHNVPRSIMQTEPIKYLSKVILRNNNAFFNKYNLVLATPDNYLIENHLIEKKTHKWMVKIEKLDLRPKRPIF